MIKYNISKREKYILIATIVTIISAIAYNFIFEVIFKKWTYLNSEITIKQAKLRKAIKLLENRNNIIRNYNEYASSVANRSKILGYIEKVADSLAIKTSNIKPMPVVQKGLYKEYIIEVQIEGEYGAISKFLSQMMKPPLSITVKKFDFRTIRGSPSQFKGTLILSKLII